MTTDYKRPESVLVVVYTVSGEVLLLECRRPAGYWQSVTGSLEWGESAHHAAIREVREETGLRVQESLVDCACSNRFEIAPAWQARYAPGVDWNTEHVFRVEIAAKTPINIHVEEHLQAEWVPAQQAAERVGSHTNRAAIERYVSARII